MSRTRSRQRRTAPAALAALGLVAVAAGCGSDADNEPAPHVSPAEAYVAIVRWEVAEGQPEPGNGDDSALPIIYLRAESGDIVDIGVQADVVEATIDDSVVRFSDDSDDSLDTDLDGEPVKDNGVLLIVGDLPSGAATIDAVVRRYETIASDKVYRVAIVASDEGAKVIEASLQEAEAG